MYKTQKLWKIKMIQRKALFGIWKNGSCTISIDKKLPILDYSCSLLSSRVAKLCINNIVLWKL